MSTFSQLVDEIADQLLRPDQLGLIASQLNLTMREVFATDRNTPVFFGASRVEAQVTATAESGMIWTPDNPYIFQQLETIRYNSVLDNEGKATYPREVLPGRAINQVDYFYYRTGDSYALQGYGGVGAVITLSYFNFVPTLKYYAAGSSRPAEFDPVDGWTYQEPYNTDVAPDDKEKARLLTSNWLILKWKEVLAEGTRAKMYKLASDDNRARVSFSLFQNLRETLYRTEAINSLRQ